jgi:aspartyl-tRNA(Asn)/glutamyl-tRNA(Gln) amidotransferase subunit A
MQLVGDEMREALLLQIAAAFEGATTYHRMRPPTFTTVRI